MNFQISTQELNYLINKVQNVVPPKPTVPIIANVLIEASNDEIVFTATDLAVSIRCSTEGTILKEGSVTLPAKRFAQLIRELSAAHCEISSDANETITLIAGTSRFKVHGLNKEQFPSMPDLKDGISFTIQQKELKDLIYRTSFAASKEDNRYALSGIHLQLANGTVTLTGTDGRRLARAYAKIEGEASESREAIIPLKAIDEISKNLLEEGTAKISFTSDKIAVEANQTVLFAKLLLGEYPDINRIIPTQMPIILTLHREELMALLRQVSLFTVDHQHAARFAFSEGELKLSANTKDFGEGNVGMPVNYLGQKLEIPFNPGSFLDILRHCKEEVVSVALTDAYNPGVITDGEPPASIAEASPFFLIMPMRLSED